MGFDLTREASSELLSHDLVMLLNSLPTENHLKGKAFERIAKWWLENDPVWTRKFKKTWLWDDWPGRSGPDIGIDLVAESDEGLWAIQAKCFADTRQIPKAELDSFVSASSTQIFSNRLLIATTDKLSTNAIRTLRENSVTRVLLSQLMESEVKWPRTVQELQPTEISKFEPRDHQANAIKNVNSSFQSADRGMLVMACGTGKTLTSLWISEALQSTTTLVLVPSLSLLSQTLRQWAANSNTDWKYLCVCSDETVNKDLDQSIMNVDELPFPVTTDTKEINKFLLSGGKQVVFSTYNSLPRVIEAQKVTGSAFDLAIMDEAHRLTGQNFGYGYESLDDEKLKAKKKLFMTATPRTFSSSLRTKAEELGVQVNSMDDEKLFGKVFHNLSFGEAIQGNLLSDYQVVVIGVTNEDVKELIDKRAFVSMSDDNITTDAYTLATQLGLAKAAEQYNLRRTISFHSRVKSAEHFAKTYPDVAKSLKGKGQHTSNFITGSMSATEKRLRIASLEQGSAENKTLLTNARCLTEGIDVPSLDGVAFIDPRQSQIDIVQAVGRAIRLSESKTLGTIVIPVLVNLDMGPADISKSDFSKIWSVINALRSHDASFSEELDSVRIDLGKSGSVREISKKVTFILPQPIEKLHPGFQNAIQIKVLEQVSDNWAWWFGLLLSYREENELGTPSTTEIYRGFKLGSWVAMQRSTLKNLQENSPNWDRRLKLEALSGWFWDSNEDSWEKRFKALEQYAIEFGHARPPHKFVYKGVELGDFVRVLRWGYKTYGVREDRIKELEALPGWAWVKHDGVWLDFYDRLLEYVATNKRFPNSQDRENKDLRSLYNWCSTQRKNQLTLSAEKREKLELIEGWTWDPLAASWNENLSKAIEFVQNIQPSSKVTIPRTEDRSLDEWIRRQRLSYLNGELSEEKLQKLKPIMHLFIAEPAKSQWEIYFDLLLAYKQKNADIDVPEDYVEEGLRLGHWISRQRSRYKNKTISEQEISRLETIDEWMWDPLKEKWDSMYLKIKNLSDVNGHIFLLQRDFLKELDWLTGQRKKMRRGILEPERAKLLESLPGWSWNSAEVCLDRGISEARSYVEANGHLKVAPDERFNGFPLGRWCIAVRKSKSKGLLSEKAVSKVAQIPLWNWGRNSNG